MAGRHLAAALRPCQRCWTGLTTRLARCEETVPVDPRRRAVARVDELRDARERASEASGFHAALVVHHQWPRAGEAMDHRVLVDELAGDVVGHEAAPDQVEDEFLPRQSRADAREEV